MRGSKKLSFADPIRQALQELGIEKDRDPDLYRSGAQYIGTDLCRAYDPNWWVKQMKRRVNSAGGIYQHLIIDDMRFENEHDYCDNAGFLLVRIDVSRETQLTRGAQPDMLDHASETGLDGYPEWMWDLWIPEATTVEERVGLVKTAWDSLSQTGYVPVRA